MREIPIKNCGEYLFFNDYKYKYKVSDYELYPLTESLGSCKIPFVYYHDDNGENIILTNKNIKYSGVYTKKELPKGVKLC